MIRNSIAAAAVLFVSAATIVPAASEPAPPDNAGGRYIFEKQAGGQDSAQGPAYVRLDTKTGEVALCSQRAIGWACEAAPEDRAVLEGEIARLRAENGALKKELLFHGLPLPPGAAAEAAAPGNRIVVPLPSNADIDRMVAMVGQVWRRLVEAIQQAQKQVFNKS